MSVYKLQTGKKVTEVKLVEDTYDVDGSFGVVIADPATGEMLDVLTVWTGSPVVTGRRVFIQTHYLKFFEDNKLGEVISRIDFGPYESYMLVEFKEHL